MYTRYKNLKFFNKEGQQYQFIYDNEKNIWTGTIHLPPVSVNVFENETIYILEEIEDISSDIKYSAPLKESTTIVPKFNFKFLDKEETISLFKIDNEEIYELEEIDIDILGSSYTINNVTERKVSNNGIESTIRIDICFNTKIENAYTRILNISDDYGDIAIIEIYGEGIGEDERFTGWLSNFGKTITLEDYKIFKNSDIDEPFVDYKILNAKRKELLVEYKNIFQYNNAYKGLVNIIKFFGYYDIRLKELFYNSETNKYIYDEVKLYEYDKSNNAPRFNIKPYNKTSFFSLFYDIVRDKKGEFHENGLPKTEKAYQYTQEEILIKLYGLKNYIDVNDIGGIANIADIVGEFVAYHKYSYKKWVNQYKIQDIKSGGFSKFSVNSDFGYIEDMRNYLNPFGNYSVSREWTAITDPTLQLATNLNTYLGYFDMFNRDEIEYQDDPDIPIGFKLDLKNESFTHSWNDSLISWEESIYQNILITWGNYSSLLVTDVEWVIKYQRNQNYNINKNLTYVHRKYGNKVDLLEYTVILPYRGYYDITLTLHCFNGEKVTNTIKKAVFVDMKNADSTSFYRILDYELQYWNSNFLKWSDVPNEWKSNIFDSTKFIVDDSRISYRAMLHPKWFYLNRFKNVSIGIHDVRWNSYKNTVTWSDAKYTSFEYLKYKKERLAKFTIEKLIPNSEFQTNDRIYSMGDINIHDHKALSDNLNMDLGRLYQFTARPINSSTYVDCVSLFDDQPTRMFIGSPYDNMLSDKCYINWEDFKDISWSSMPIIFGNSNYIWEAEYKHNMFTMSDLYFFNDSFVAPVFTNIFFVVDNSDIAGKYTIVWKLIKEDIGEDVVEITSRNFSYRFIAEGQYSIEITIIDNMGNFNKRYRKNLINICQSEKFKYVR